MNSVKTQLKTVALRACAGASIALMGLGLAGCSSTSETTASNAPTTVSASAETAGTTPSQQGPAPTETASTPTESSVAATERHATLSVTGAKDSALVKTLVISSDGKESGGEMKQQALPFTQELTIPAGTDFTKILVLGKYANGETGEISCSVAVEGKTVSTNSSTGHQPAECLVLENGGKN